MIKSVWLECTCRYFFLVSLYFGGDCRNRLLLLLNLRLLFDTNLLSGTSISYGGFLSGHSGLGVVFGRVWGVIDILGPGCPCSQVGCLVAWYRGLGIFIVVLRFMLRLLYARFRCFDFDLCTHSSIFVMIFALCLNVRSYPVFFLALRPFFLALRPFFFALSPSFLALRPFISPLFSCPCLHVLL